MTKTLRDKIKEIIWGEKPSTSREVIYEKVDAILSAIREEIPKKRENKSPQYPRYPPYIYTYPSYIYNNNGYNRAIDEMLEKLK